MLPKPTSHPESQILPLSAILPAKTFTVDWESMSQGKAPSCLAAVRIPIAHLSVQIAWANRLVIAQRMRNLKTQGKRNRLQSRRRYARKLAAGKPITPLQLAAKRAKHRLYMATYRAKRAAWRASISRRLRLGYVDSAINKARERRELKRLKKLQRKEKRLGIY